jgi:trimethylamine:corrinoid methyltransferase-like protein
MNSPSTWAQAGARAIADAVAKGKAHVLAGQGHRVADAVLISVLTEFFAARRTSRAIATVTTSEEIRS